METGARYDGLAEWYDAFVGRADATNEALEELLRLSGPGTGRCLDLGCGTGVAIEPLTRLGWRVVGVDVSADQLRVARERLGPDAELVHADAAGLPFEDAEEPGEADYPFLLAVTATR